MRQHGWPYSAHPRPWTTLATEYEDFGPDFAHVGAIVASVIAADDPSALAAFTSMHDLLVVATPLRDPSYDVVAVRTPGDGRVLIEHLSVTRLNDRLERPSSDAVPLFWRFMIEKFGVSSGFPTEKSP